MRCLKCYSVPVTTWVVGILYILSLERRQHVLYIFIYIYIYIYKVKGTLVQALRLCTGRTAHRGNKVINLLFLDHGIRRGWGVSVTPRPFFTPGKTRYPLYSRLGGSQGRSGQVRRISPPSGFDPRTVPRSQSLYWLRYPAHIYIYMYICVCVCV